MGVALEKGTVPPTFLGKFPVKKLAMITKSPLRMSRFPVGLRRAIVKNTKINNMGVAEKRNCPASFPKKLPSTQIPN